MKTIANRKDKTREAELRAQLQEARAEVQWYKNELDMAEAKLEMIYLIFGREE